MIAAALIVLEVVAVAANTGLDPVREEAGRVQSFEGHVSDYRLIRGDTQVEEQVAFLLPLYAGDTVVVQPHGRPIRLVVGSEKGQSQDVIVCGAMTRGCDRSPSYRVGAPHHAALPSAYLSWIRSIGKALTVDPPKVIRLEVRGGEPKLEPAWDGQQIVEGTRSLLFEWSGPDVPCSLTVTAVNSGERGRILRSDGLHGRIATAPLLLVPGDYGIEVACGGLIPTSARFVVVPRDAVPELPRFNGLNVDLSMQVVLESAWLASQGWTLEAYLRLEDAHEKNSAVESLRSALKSGWKPETPDDRSSK